MNGFKCALIKYLLITGFAIITIQTSKLKSQTISTVGEIYDYEIGDIFHFITDIDVNWGGHDSILQKIEIINKYYSQNNDTVFYLRDVLRWKKILPSTSWVFDNYQNVVSYTDLDSTIFSYNLPNPPYTTYIYSDTNKYNGRQINRIRFMIPEENENNYYVNGCGIAHYSWQFSQTLSGRTISLIYFKKGLEEYGSSNMISTDITEYVDKHLSIFPNPVSNQLTIVSSQAINKVEIIDLTGKLIKTFKENTGILDVSDLNSGIYFIKLIADEETITKKFVKE